MTRNSDSDADPRTDREELKEVIKGFLNKYYLPNAGMSETRIHKAVYYGELYCLHEYGHRLTDASFKPYHYGSFSETIREVLNEMVGNGIEKFEPRGTSGEQYRATESAKLSSEKKQIIDEIHEKLKDYSTEDLAQFSKGSWLYENTSYGESMDFEQFRDEMLLSPIEWRSLSLDERNPVGEDADTIADLTT